jgi:hypothetical protein
MSMPEDVGRLTFFKLFQIGQFVPAIHAHTFAPVLHQWDISIGNVKKFLLVRPLHSSCI